ncbi:hypothetical protein TNCV_3912971 [Trichonephila clavipes]|nr:hypothetical protein TNCV_3912971 [Trichonephila clavipes]
MDKQALRQSMHWKSPSTDSQKSSIEQIKITSNDDCFLDIHGIVYLHWVPEGQTINPYHYLRFCLTPSKNKEVKIRIVEGQVVNSPSSQCNDPFRIVCLQVSSPSSQG